MTFVNFCSTQSGGRELQVFATIQGVIEDLGTFYPSNSPVLMPLMIFFQNHKMAMTVLGIMPLSFSWSELGNMFSGPITLWKEMVLPWAYKRLFFPLKQGASAWYLETKSTDYLQG